MAYKSIPKIMKDYSRRLAKLNQKVAELRFYWEKRSAERERVNHKLKELQLTLERLYTLEKGLAGLMNRKYFTIRSREDHKTKQGNQSYPLFITQYECNRLRQLLNRPRRLVYAVKGKRLIWLTVNECNRLKQFMKKDWRFK